MEVQRASPPAGAWASCPRTGRERDAPGTAGGTPAVHRARALLRSRSHEPNEFHNRPSRSMRGHAYKGKAW